MDLLIKPFIICCTDGYFIDCYGPFAANQNYASILEYILKTDQGLNNLLQPFSNTLIFLYRGFRDIFKNLVNQYGFRAFIPSCNQLYKENVTSDNENDLDENQKIKKGFTTIQTSNTRFVTKSRL